MAMKMEYMAGVLLSVPVIAMALPVCRTRTSSFPSASFARIPSVGRERATPIPCCWYSRSCGLRTHKSLRAIAKGLSVRASESSQAASSGDDTAAAVASTIVTTATTFKHLMLPIMDKNPYLSAATRQAAATTTSLANMYGANITVVVIDENELETTEHHEVRMKNIRWHLAEGGFKDFTLVERLGEGKRPAAVIGEVADDMGLDLVVLSMESIHSKHVDSNLLAEFVPCPVLLLPL
ncbi:unnamed protein product [Sphagnum jensenii]|uniref:Universal stress protein n=1 Tax=Sphagnum jensenii TaxID=128206 RepID=A0ABP0XC27_9BRYO